MRQTQKTSGPTAPLSNQFSFQSIDSFSHSFISFYLFINVINVDKQEKQ